MPSKPQPNPPQDKTPQDKDVQRQSLPFEPKKRKSADAQSLSKKPSVASSVGAKAKQAKAPALPSSAASGIPEVVSRRMVRRMALFCGLPTALGMSTFVVSYLVVSNDLIDLPPYAVLLVSLGWFGLGVIGLTYGVLSASWDENEVGSKLGWTEFKTNWGRTLETWRSNDKSAARQPDAKSSKKS